MWVDSAGFGNGGWGQTPYGDGPFVTFPHTPGFSYSDERGYAVDVQRSALGPEVRFLQSRARGLALSYNFSPAHSWEAAGVRSFLLQARGTLDPFFITDHRTQRTYVARLATDVEIDRGAGRQVSMPPLTFAIVRDRMLSEEILQDRPVGYWPLTDPLTLGNTASSWALASLVDTVAAWYVATGTATVPTAGIEPAHIEEDVDADVARPTNLTGRAHVSSHARWNILASQTFCVELGVLAGATAANSLRILAMNASSGTASWVVGIAVGGAPFFTFIGTTGVTLTGPTSICDETPHHIFCRRERPSQIMDLWVDGTVVASVADTSAGTGTIGGFPTFWAQSSGNVAMVDSSATFQSYLTHVAVYSAFPGTARVAAHAAAMRRSE